MKKFFSRLLIPVLSAIFCTACSLSDFIYIPEKQQKNYTVLRLANNHEADYPTSIACDYFAELVEQETNGKIKIICYHNCALGDEASTIEQLKLGGIDFVRAPVSLLSSYDPDLNVLTLPYLYENDTQMWNVLKGSIGDSLLSCEKLAENNMVGLCWYTAGSRSFYSSVSLENGLDSIKGLKIRTQDSSILRDTIEALGADAVTINFEDVYSALLTSKIDGAENNIPSYVSTQHYKAAKYFLADEHSRVPEIIAASKSTMDSLPEDYQEIIKQCAVKSTEKQIQLWNEYEQQSLKTAEENGCIIITPTEEQKAELKNAVKGIKDAYSDEYGDLISKIENMPY